MKVAVFSSKQYDRTHLDFANEQEGRHALSYFDAHLDAQTAVLANGFDVACVFVNDQLDREVLTMLRAGGVSLVTTRSAGFNHIDVAAAAELGITVSRVPAYSPYAVAEHAAGLILTLNRKFHRAYARVREGNFSLEGLCGFDLHGRIVGVVGTGTIGVAFARIMNGFGCKLIAFDPKPNDACKQFNLQYVSIEELFRESDIISLHCPLVPATRHLINAESIAKMKSGVMIINTGRGALVDTPAVVRGLKSEKIGFLGLDVYEEEEQLFFEDLSTRVIQDDVFMRLLTFPNVVVTAHQGFFTEEALRAIAHTTIANINGFSAGKGPLHRVPC